MKEQIQGNADEDLEAVSLSRKGDIDSFEALVRKYEKRMLNIAYRMIGNYEDACEVVQDAFVSAYKGIKGFEGKSSFSTWLYAIVLNLSRNRLRQLISQELPRRNFYRRPSAHRGRQRAPGSCLGRSIRP